MGATVYPLLGVLLRHIPWWPAYLDVTRVV